MRQTLYHYIAQTNSNRCYRAYFPHPGFPGFPTTRPHNQPIKPADRCCSDLCYYNTGNYATIEDRARMIIRLNMKCWAPNIYIWYFCQCVLRTCGGENRES